MTASCRKLTFTSVINIYRSEIILSIDVEFYSRSETAVKGCITCSFCMMNADIALVEIAAEKNKTRSASYDYKEQESQFIETSIHVTFDIADVESV